MDDALTLKTQNMLARRQGPVGWMTFNQPEKHNAVSYEMWAAVPEILDDFAQDDAIRVVVLKGAGKRAFTMEPSGTISSATSMTPWLFGISGSRSPLSA